MGCGLQHGAGAGIEWVAVIKCVGCGMQHPSYSQFDDTESENLLVSIRYSKIMQAIRRLAPSVVKYTSRMYNPARFFGGSSFERLSNCS